MSASGTIDLQPTLRGELVELRPLRAEDFGDLYAAASDPLIWEQHPVQRHEAEVFRSYFRESLESGGALVIVDRESGRIIGSSRYHGYDGARRAVEIGWSFLERAYWGGRYNGEVKRLMLDHAFGFVDRVLFLVAPGNLRSQRAVEKIGGVRVGSRPNAYGLESYVFEVTSPGPATETDRCTD